MTWNINIMGHDSLTGDEKIAYEKNLVEKARAFSADLKSVDGGVVNAASAVTNTTGSVDLLN